MANDITPKTLTQRQSTGKAAIFHSITRVKTAYGRKVYGDVLQQGNVARRGR